ncbi:ornithine cyclodeaminase [Labrenzia sp. PHM005]|uniref:ornithine cyclodeaminase n=1 Tax=Labrenzia sp. PHM005 TaxID=2590016 RepID=UPI0011407434|nr:ornithine cyclodeaminase [Labrenzia sp. PHM005]QDG74644.1 ornithine cyclodeaminase [Labrenzia sp. PHM005]
MRIISSGDIDTSLTDRDAVEILRQAFRSPVKAPDPINLNISRPQDLTGQFLVQPVWSDFAGQGHTDRGYIGCSLSLALPEQEGGSSNLYILFSGKGGQPIALLDGVRLAAWRDAGLHALAVAYLSREDAQRLLIVGSDPRLPRLLAAYSAVRNITSVLFAGTDKEIRRRIAGMPDLAQITARTTDDIGSALEGADIVCLAGKNAGTNAWADLSRFDPPAGCHIDTLFADPPLPEMIWQDARLFTTHLGSAPRDGCEWTAGLTELAMGERAGRRYYGQRTLYVPGYETGLADFALAAHVFLKS